MYFANPEQLVHLTVMVLACTFALWRGGAPERIGAGLLILAWLVSPLVEDRSSWLAPQYGIFAVDACLLVALIALAVNSGRYWPICAAAFQLLAVLTHLAFLINPRALYRAYLYANFALAFPVFGALAAGAWLEPRRTRRGAGSGPAN